MSVFFDRAGFVARLDELRNRYGLSKGEFADRVGMAQIFSRYKEPKPGAKERKIQAPSVDTLLSIASVFHTSVDWLLTGNDPCVSAQQPLRVEDGKDWIRLPEHDPRRLSQPDREALEDTLLVLRSPEIEGGYSESLYNNIKSFAHSVRRERQLAKKVEAKKGRVNGP